MINPTPLLRPSPMDIGALFAGTFEALRRRFGLFILLALAPALLLLGLFLIAALIAASAAVGIGRNGIVGALLWVGLLALIGTIAVVLVQIKAAGLMALAAYEIAQDQRPDFAGLMARSRGFLPRMLVVVLIIGGVILAGYLLVIGLIIVIANSGSSRNGAAAGLAVVLVLIFLAAIPVAIGFAVRLLYVVPVVAIEQLGGLAALKRSWTLTRREFWRTLGFWLVPQVAVVAISMVIDGVAQAGGATLADQVPPGSDLGEAMTYLLAALPLLTVSIALQVGLQVVTTPLLQTYNTYMFIDQVRRSEHRAEPYGAAPAGPGQPGYGYWGAQPGPGYPPQQYQPSPYPTGGMGDRGYNPANQWPGQPQSEQPPPYPGGRPTPYPTSADQQQGLPGYGPQYGQAGQQWQPPQTDQPWSRPGGPS